MIRVECPHELIGLIDRSDELWCKRAQDRYAACRKARMYIWPPSGSEIWASIKHVLLGLQYGKCAYCERKLSSAAVEWDVEHYRPKSRTRPWPAARRGSRESDAYSVKSGRTAGYWWLAHCPFNYIVICKTCNSDQKRDYFPIAGRPARPPKSSKIPGRDYVRRLAETEQPLLIYPVGDIDTDPEALLGFEGIAIQIREPDSAAGQRARVTIDLLGLAHREELLEERALVIAVLAGALARHNEKLVRALVDPSARHAACARAFVRLSQSDPVRARRIEERVRTYLETREPVVSRV